MASNQTNSESYSDDGVKSGSDDQQPNSNVHKHIESSEVGADIQVVVEKQ